MTNPKPISPGLKLALELGPVLIFFVAYLQVREETFTILGRDYTGFIVVTIAFIPLLLASMAILRKLTGKISRMQVVTAVMVIFFGGLTVYFNDERFFKMKTTIVYGLFASILGFGLLRGKSFLAYVMEDMLPMTEEGFMILTKRLTAAFGVLAVANEFVWRTMSTDAWVKIETFGFPVALFAFFMLQSKLFEEHMIETDET
ncbi:MAG: intracellular septation protein [Sulfitobacter sp.]|jgi:intracellular septation protein